MTTPFTLTASLLLLALIVWLSVKYGMLGDKSMAQKKPYSFSRTQLAYWTWIIFTCVFYAWEREGFGSFPPLNDTALILLGITTATTAGAALVDASQSDPATIIARHQNENTGGFLIDILSDENGVSIHRLQGFVFHLVYGGIFLHTVLYSQNGVVWPEFSTQALALLGVSSGTYVGMKIKENYKPIVG